MRTGIRFDSDVVCLLSLLGNGSLDIRNVCHNRTNSTLFVVCRCTVFYPVKVGVDMHAFLILLAEILL